MANAAYNNYRNLLVGNGTHTLPDPDTDTLRAVLVDAGTYTLDLVNDQDENDLSGVITNGEATLTNVSSGAGFSAGAVDCDDIAWTSVSGSTAEYVIIFQDTGTPTTSPLMVVYDTTNTGLPLSPTGGNVTGIVNASGLYGV